MDKMVNALTCQPHVIEDARKLDLEAVFDDTARVLAAMTIQPTIFDENSIRSLKPSFLPSQWNNTQRQHLKPSIDRTANRKPKLHCSSAQVPQSASLSSIVFSVEQYPATPALAALAPILLYRSTLLIPTLLCSQQYNNKRLDKRPSYLEKPLGSNSWSTYIVAVVFNILLYCDKFRRNFGNLGNLIRGNW
ncbi:hypothetical protein NE237_005969 [Protea cynaroides]|uniref:Uncharacterized protein n=1 Tax=Protea cynaroides TaxID=273540 RepID=A0A9Q0QUZ6_9MAGN|nr:hypothetical protein NE237_005969 [Protea cynaroides]